MVSSNQEFTRRRLLKDGFRNVCILGIGGASGILMARGQTDQYCWQIDPQKCIACGNCATFCVLEESAVKCVQTYAMCGYCKLCTGFFDPAPNALNTGAENQLCPTGAIIRTFVEDPYYEYTIDESLCIGCGKCVKWCKAFGNGSFYLQVRHDRCVNCNQCAIAAACPSEAFQRVPADQPYLLKGTNHSG
ncbi:MAG: ferredoxin [Candidatus Omnitrophota bacterium]|jgi:electron transport complex protein RnfB|nr:MAG: ferredoxin [Candidatus Omnitrophota bacterium]